MISPPSLVGFIVSKLGHPRRENYPLCPVRENNFTFYLTLSPQSLSCRGNEKND